MSEVEMQAQNVEVEDKIRNDITQPLELEHKARHDQNHVVHDSHYTEGKYTGIMDEVLSVAEEIQSVHSSVTSMHRAKWLPDDPYLRAAELFKYGWSSGLVLFSLCLIFYNVSLRYCVWNTYPVVLFILLFAATTMLAYVEALHYANVSVEKWDMTPYRERFPRACKTQILVKSNKLVQRFLVGRQFFVIFVVFIIANITSFPNVPTKLWGMPETFVLLIVQIGVPGVMWVLTIGQLIPQLFVEEFTIPFLNLPGCYAVTKICFAAEYVGICHFSWILFYSVSSLIFGTVHETAAKAISTEDPEVGENAVTLTQENIASLNGESAGAVPTAGDVHVLPDRRVEFDEISLTPSQLERDSKLNWWDVVRYTWSTGVTFGSILVVCYGIYHHYSVLPAPVPALYIIFVGALALLFYLEGLMICIVATQYWDKEKFQDTHPRAYYLHELVNRPENLKKFIVGRQFFTVLTNFLIAQIAVFPTWPSDGYNSVIFFLIIKTGIVGIMITLAFAQLLPELLGARYPLFFMNMYGSYSVVRLSLFIEWVGIGHCAWLIYFATRPFACGKYMAVGDLKPDVIEVEDKHKK